MSTFHLEVVTPHGRTFHDDVDSVVIPGVEGEFGVLPQHMPLMTMIHAGELVIKKGSQEQRVPVGEGFVEVLDDHVFVLTDPQRELGEKPVEIS